MKYRAEIDGLRALAVVPVILFHAGFEMFSGGFVGVDVFFVVSGYLITTILIEDIENKRFSIFNFYERRARRILPALFFVMLVCIPFAWMWMLPSQMKDFSQSLVAVSLFISNHLFWRESGYFESAAEEKPLLHTWSLAVEEQYYVLFPIFIVLSWRFGKNRVFWMIVVMAAISLLISEWGWRYKATANFYLAPTRAWELFAGSIAAFVVYKRGVQKNDGLALLGLAAIVFSIFVYDESIPFPSVYALLPVVGVVLLVLYADKETLVSRLLSNKAFVGIGLISYSAYLWHQPLFAFARIEGVYASTSSMVVLSLMSMILAFVSWKFIETPFREKLFTSQSTIFISSISVIVLFSVFGLFGHFKSSQIEQYWLTNKDTEFQQLYQRVSDSSAGTHNWYATKDGRQVVGECRFNVREINDETENLLDSCNDRHGSGILILGDSHAIDLFGVVASRFDNDFIVGVTQGGCRPHSNYSHCHYDAVKNYINSRPTAFSMVIYEQAGHYLLLDKDGTKGSRDMFSNLSLDGNLEGISIDHEHIYGTAQFLSELSQLVPVKWFLPRAEPHISTNTILKLGCAYDYQYRENQLETFENLDSYIESYVSENFPEDITPISQNHLFLFQFPQDFMTCDTIYWSDGDHLSAEGEQYFGQRLPSDFLLP